MSLGGAVAAALAASPEGLGSKRENGCSPSSSSFCTTSGLAGVVMENTFESIPRHIASQFQGFFPLAMQGTVLSIVTRLAKDE